MEVNVQKRTRTLFLCFVLAFATLSITTKSSYLYPMNDWVDVQCFFTVGKGMFHGVLPYAELAEQKGPFVYLLYGMAYLLSPNSSIGGFVLEVISGAFFLFFAYQIFRLYSEQYAWITTVVVSVIAFTALGFVHGGAVEEFALSLWAYAMFSALRILRGETESALRRIAYFNGFWMGVLFFSKFTLVGIYAGIAVLVVIHFVIAKEYRMIYQIAWRVTVGFVLAIVPWILYFCWRGIVADFIEWYFYNNLFLYPSNRSFASALVGIVMEVARACWRDWDFALFALLSCGGLGYHAYCTKKWRSHILLLVVMACSALFIYIGGRDALYYSLPLVAILLPGVGMVLAMIERWSIFTWKDSVCSVIVSFTVAIGMSYLLSSNVYLMRYEKEDLPQYRFATIINQVENPKVLNYGFLDGGFYSAANVIPSEKYFCQLNVFDEKMLAEHRSYIEHQKVDFVVVRGKTSVSFETYGYELVAHESFFFEGATQDYYLYQHV